MKFPLKERPFPHVELSPERFSALEDHIDAVVDATLEEFRSYVHVHNRTLSKHQWKAIKRRENVTTYKDLNPREQRTVGPLGVRNETLAMSNLILPKLLAVGTVHGNMHDMLLGLALHDAPSAIVKSSYVDDALVDCEVLQEMRSATPDDPFRYVALKWLVKAHPSGLNSMVAPRDMVVMQSSGLVPDQNLGYHVLQSVELPEFGSLESRTGILRSRICTTFVFRQQAKDVVEVYVTNSIEPNGSAPESVGIVSAAKSMNGSWKAIGCAHNMKLSWILKNRDCYMGSTPHATLNTDDKCELCFNKATLGGRLADCSLCESRVCSRCRVTKKLSHANRRLELSTTKHEFCKTCLFRVINEDSKRIAGEMYLGDPIMPWHTTEGSVSSSFDRANRRRSGASSSGSSGWRSHRSHTSNTSHGRQSEDDLMSVNSDSEGSTYIARGDEWAYGKSQEFVNAVALTSSLPKTLVGPNKSSLTRSSSSTASSTRSGSARGEEFWQLYSQMQALQMAAEKTYEITKDNTRHMRHNINA